MNKSSRSATKYRAWAAGVDMALQVSSAVLTLQEVKELELAVNRVTYFPSGVKEVLFAHGLVLTQARLPTCPDFFFGFAIYNLLSE